MAGPTQPTQQGYTPLGIYNGPIPKEGPKSIPVGLSFGAQNTFVVDFTYIYTQGWISEIQACWIDNSANNASLTLVSLTTNQTIVVPAGFQGTVPILSRNPPLFKAQSAGNASVQLQFLNVPIISQNWSSTGASFKFDASGYLEVDDVTLNTLMNSLANGTGQLNVSNWVLTHKDTIQPLFKGSDIFTGTDTATAAATIIAGSPNFFFTFAEILLTPDATIAVAGELTATLTDSGTATVIATGVAYVPSVAPTISQATAPILLILLEDLEYIGRNAAGGSLTLTLSAALTAGKVFFNVAGGTTAKIGA